MLRTVPWVSTRILLAAGLILLAGGGELAAQDAWPAYTTPFQRGLSFQVPQGDIECR